MWKKQKKICGCVPCTENDLARAIREFKTFELKQFIVGYGLLILIVANFFFDKEYEFIFQPNKNHDIFISSIFAATLNGIQ